MIGHKLISRLVLLSSSFFLLQIYLGNLKLHSCHLQAYFKMVKLNGYTTDMFCK